jgi:hypothetical protein
MGRSPRSRSVQSETRSSIRFLAISGKDLMARNLGAILLVSPLTGLVLTVDTNIL